ncbi:MAG: hypothetical protein HYR74_06685 [Candidatus Eisenbacteria bacterium]|nr:hypothetical protein [Candidatus Eisenbacteria bacterium]
MQPWVWGLAGIAAAAVAAAIWRSAGRQGRVRAAVLDEVRRMLRGGAIERPPGRGIQARGRLGELEITVDLHRDPSRPRQSPMWRVLAVGPVSIDRPVEARIADWDGWIDPWLQLGETLVVPAGAGPEFTLHGERMPTLEHVVVVALRRQGERLGAGALHARPDLMRAETRFHAQAEANHPLFALLRAMAEVSEGPRTRSPRMVSPRHATAPRVNG